MEVNYSDNNYFMERSTSNIQDANTSTKETDARVEKGAGFLTGKEQLKNKFANTGLSKDEDTLKISVDLRNTDKNKKELIKGKEGLPHEGTQWND